MNAPATIEHMTQDLRKCNNWFRERDVYIRDAVEFRSHDWITFDDEATVEALTRIQRAMTLPADECKQVVISAISGLIQHCAVGHANYCERNGSLED